jgi:predicted DCC family thiol-disulfide oxidoreductase YuxK
MMRNILFRGRQMASRSFSSIADSRAVVFNNTFSHCLQTMDSGPDCGTADMRAKNRIIVFFDGKCKLCTSEIRHYENLLHATTSPIAFFDLTENEAETREILREFGIPEGDPFKRVHVVVENSKYEVLVSTRAFCEIWSRVPQWHNIVPFVKNVPGVIQMSDFVYGFIAETRMKILPSRL